MKWLARVMAVLSALGGLALLLFGARRQGREEGAAVAEAAAAETAAAEALQATQAAVAEAQASPSPEADERAREAAGAQRERLLRRVRGGALVLGMLLAPSMAWAKGKPPDPVKDCPVGLVCMLPEEVTEVEVRLIHLERDLRLAQARVKRVGLTAGCGPGAAVLLDGGELSLEPNIFCGLVWGVRW